LHFEIISYTQPDLGHMLQLLVLLRPQLTSQGFANVVFLKEQIIETRTLVQSSLSKWEGSEGTCCVGRSGQFLFHRLLLLDVVL
jgi:hypothetical protein